MPCQLQMHGDYRHLPRPCSRREMEVLEDSWVPGIDETSGEIVWVLVGDFVGIVLSG